MDKVIWFLFIMVIAFLIFSKNNKTKTKPIDKGFRGTRGSEESFVENDLVDNDLSTHDTMMEYINQMYDLIKKNINLELDLENFPNADPDLELTLEEETYNLLFYHLIKAYTIAKLYPKLVLQTDNNLFDFNTKYGWMSSFIENNNSTSYCIEKIKRIHKNMNLRLDTTILLDKEPIINSDIECHIYRCEQIYKFLLREYQIKKSISKEIDNKFLYKLFCSYD